MTIGTERLDRMIFSAGNYSADCEAMLLPLVSAYEPGYVRCVHTIDARFANANRVVFGGYVAALLDYVSGYTAMTMILDDKVCSTAELSISYFRPCAPGEELVLEGFLINQSRRSYHIEATIKRQDQKLISKARAVFALSPRT